MTLIQQLKEALDKLDAEIDAITEEKAQAHVEVDKKYAVKNDLIVAERNRINIQLAIVTTLINEQQEAFNILMLTQKTGALTDDDFRTFAKESGLELLPEFEIAEEDTEEIDESEEEGID